MSYFSLFGFQNSLCVFYFWQFDNNVSQCGLLWGLPRWKPLGFLHLDVYFLSGFGKLCSFFLKKIFLFFSLSPPSVTPTMHILFRLRVFQKSLRFSSLFFILFLFLPVLMESPLHYALDWVLQLLIWCSEFSQKYSSPYTVLKMVSPWGMRACFSLVHHLAEVIPNCLIFTPTFILLNEDYYIQLTLSNTGG